MLDPLIGSARAARHAAARALLRHGPRHPAARARLTEAARAAGHVWDAGHPVTAIHDLGTTVTAVLRPRAELQDDDHAEVAPARPKLLAPR